MKHRILIEFSAETLPDDFLDQIAGRVYGHPAVDKKECTASFVGDVLKDAGRYQKIRNPPYSDNWGDVYAMTFQRMGDIPIKGEFLDEVVDAAKDTQ